MIKPGEYIQIIEFFDANNQFTYTYCTSENIDILEAAKRFDELRDLHAKYKKECDLYTIYRNLDCKKMNELAGSIKQMCAEFKIIPVFYDPKTTNYKSGWHTNYHYKTRSGEITDITNLLVFFIKRNKSSVARLENG